MEPVLEATAQELHDLRPDPAETWQHLLSFVQLDRLDQRAMQRTVEPLLRQAPTMVVDTYNYLASVPATAAILGWETGVDESHLEERRRFFTVWLTRTLGLDTSPEFAAYLFRAGKFHAAHGPRQIHTPSSYVTASISLMLAAFARCLNEAGLPADTIAPAMAGWSKYLLVQLHVMEIGYQVALDLDSGAVAIPLTFYGCLRAMLERSNLTVHVAPGATLGNVLVKFFNYFPHIRGEALDRAWEAEDESESLWQEVVPLYRPKRGWRVLLNGRESAYSGGFNAPVNPGDQIAIFPPGR
jgi:molybdopterin converting factor small subunit